MADLSIRRTNRRPLTESQLFASESRGPRQPSGQQDDLSYTRRTRGPVPTTPSRPREQDGGGFMSFLGDVSRNVSMGAGALGQLFGIGSPQQSNNPAGMGWKARPIPGAQQASAPEPPSIAEVLQGYLDTAAGIVPDGGAGGVGYQDFSPVRSDAQGQASRNRAYLDSIYDQLGRSVSSSNEDITQRYADSGEALQGITDASTADTEAAYAAANAERNRQLAALGIEAAAAGNIAQGTDNEIQGAQALADIAQRGQINQTANRESQRSDQTYNERIGQAGEFARAEAQRALTDSLASRMAEIAMAESDNRQQVDAQNAQLAAQSAGNSLSQQLSIVDLLRSLEQQDYDRSVQAQEYADSQRPQENFSQSYLNDLLGYGELKQGLQEANPTLAELLQDQGPDQYFSYLNSRRRFG